MTYASEHAANYAPFPCGTAHKFNVHTGLCRTCGTKSELTPAQLQAVARTAAKREKKPVKWTVEREK